MKPVTLRECLSSFHEQYAHNSRENSQKRWKLTNFLRAEYQTTMRWLTTTQEPTAERRCCAIIFFHVAGYSVAEYEAWHENLQGAAKLLAYHLFSSQALAAVFGFEGKDASSSMYKVFAGKRNLSRQKHERIALCLKEHADAIVEAEQRFRREYADMLLQETDVSAADVQADSEEVVLQEQKKVSEVSVSELCMTPEDAATQLALLVQLALPYAQFLNSESCTTEHRDLLRALAGRNGVFKLNNQLTPLCGERMRKQLEGQQ